MAQTYNAILSGVPATVENDSDYDCEDFDELLKVSEVRTLPRLAADGALCHSSGR
jgi:hypothetical protein